jgi:metal-responsive CopG/Arc/MetJ family transcriptional regulator
MAVVNFSIPDDVKQAFDRVFKGENRSAIVTALMRSAIEQAEIQRDQREVVAAIRRLARKIPPLSDEEIRAAREEGRP